MIRRTALALAAVAVVIGAGCTPRTSDIPGTYTEGGFGSSFYAELSYSAKEGQKQRVYLFGKIAHYEEFLVKKEVPENKHKKFIGKGVNRETVVIQDLDGFELKDDPRYADKLLAKYHKRHNYSGPPAVVESAPAPAPAPAAMAPEPAAAAPAAAPAPAVK